MGNHKKARNEENKLVERVEEKFLPGQGLHSVPLSLIIPVYNCSQSIGPTLESVEQQNYHPLEVIVVDAGSTDKTLEVVSHFNHLISRIYSVTHYNTPDMINRGISLASGEYISCLLPGTFFVSPWVFQTFNQQIQLAHRPDLIYCGSIQREVKREPKLIFFPFEESVLKKGKSFATLPACWLRADLFERLGRFNTHYVLRSPFEFLCRVVKEEPKIKVARLERVFVDYDLGKLTLSKSLRGAEETWRIVRRHFGLASAMSWFFTLNRLQLLRAVWNRLKSR